MTLRHFAVFGLIAASAFSLPIFTSACSDDHAHGGEGGGSGDEVLYEGSATDEAYEALVDATPVEDATQASYLSSPTAAMTVSAATPLTFSWQVGQGSAAPPSIDGARLGERASKSPNIVESLKWLVDMPVAHAHGDPVNGRAYLLEVRNGDTVVHRVFTTNLEHTPSADAWQTITEGGGERSVSVLNAVFEDNRVAQGGGPFKGTAVTFTIGQ